MKLPAKVDTAPIAPRTGTALSEVVTARASARATDTGPRVGTARALFLAASTANLFVAGLDTT